ncbi:carboxypeptidase regulatory-like domain-containing protein [Candidatus Latescibacterota bacterium]
MVYVQNTGSLTGTARDVKTGKRIEGVQITLRVGLLTYRSDTDTRGSFFIRNIPAVTNLPVSISHKNYKETILPISIVPDATTELDIRLSSTYLRVVYPNGGESIFAGSEEHILWQSVGVDSVRIEFSINGGRDWMLIVEETDASTGSYAWDVPDIPSSDYRIKITDVSRKELHDVSDGVFSNSST